MLIKLSCDKPTFKAIEFKTGMNIILAEKHKESTVKDTRNGTGKTTLVEILHFCLGSRWPEKRLDHIKLKDWTFCLELELLGGKYKVYRNTSDTGKIVLEGDFSQWSIKPKTDDRGKFYLSLKDWRDILGELMFDLRGEEIQYKPTFRSMISYFIRRMNLDRGTTFLETFSQFPQQLEWDKQVNTTFLLDLNWEDASGRQILKDREKVVNQLSKEAESGTMLGFEGNIGNLEANKIRLDEEISKLTQSIADFKIHPQYSEIKKSVDMLTKSIHKRLNENFEDEQKVQLYQHSVEKEQAPERELILKVYEEVKLELPELVKRQLLEVENFHENIIKNRKSFLEEEMQRLEKIINTRNVEIMKESQEKEKNMEILGTHGALEEFTKLNNLVSNKLASSKELSNKIEILKKIKSGKSSITVDTNVLVEKAQRNYDELRPRWEQAIKIFNENSQALYASPGNLIIEFGKRGFKFDIKIARGESQGINQMNTLCYDLTLARLWSQKEKGPGFLVHDSTIFDGVDSRQVAKALELADDLAEKFKFQYICMLNSDTIPHEDFSEGFDHNEFVVLTITDAKSDGGLLGIWLDD